jgi:hypothetical protein
MDGMTDSVSVALPREQWLAIIHAVYCAENEGQADTAVAAPIMAALGIEWGPHVLPPEVDEYERRRIAAWQREQAKRGRKRGPG